MELNDTTRQEIVDLLYKGQKIQAIKVYREATGEGLKEAKVFIEALASRLREEEPDRMPPAGQGCSATLVLFVSGVGYLAWMAS